MIRLIYDSRFARNSTDRGLHESLRILPEYVFIAKNYCVQLIPFALCANVSFTPARERLETYSYKNSQSMIRILFWFYRMSLSIPSRRNIISALKNCAKLLVDLKFNLNDEIHEPWEIIEYYLLRISLFSQIHILYYMILQYAIQCDFLSCSHREDGEMVSAL